MSVTETVVAFGENGADTCAVTFDVSIGTPPSITCPTEDIPVSLCAAGSVCVDFPISPADAVVPILEPGAVYEDGKVSFYGGQ